MDVAEGDLPRRIKELLNRAGLGISTGTTVLETQECDLRNLGCISDQDINKIYSVAAKQYAPKFIKGDDLKSNTNRRWHHLRTGSSNIDKLLRGGVPIRGLTELSGHSGCGKTQLCLQLALTVQLPLASGGLSSGAAFICTEDKFPSVRLNQLVKTCPSAQQFPDIEFANNIFVQHIADAVELVKCVNEKLPELIRKHNIGLIVVDSVAAVFRADYTRDEAYQRAKDLRSVASKLHLLANTHNIGVVCVNQVSDVKRGDTTQTVPALGLAWANLVTCRLQMFRNNNTRHLTVVFAPHLPQQSGYYSVTEAGVV